MKPNHFCELPLEKDVPFRVHLTKPIWPLRRFDGNRLNLWMNLNRCGLMTRGTCCPIVAIHFRRGWTSPEGKESRIQCRETGKFYCCEAAQGKEGDGQSEWRDGNDKSGQLYPGITLYSENNSQKFDLFIRHNLTYKKHTGFLLPGSNFPGLHSKSHGVFVMSLHSAIEFRWTLGGHLKRDTWGTWKC